MDKLMFANYLLCVIRLIEAGKNEDARQMLDRLRLQIEARG